MENWLLGYANHPNVDTGLIYHQQNHMDCSRHSSLIQWVFEYWEAVMLTVVGTCFPKFRFLASLSCVIGNKYCRVIFLEVTSSLYFMLENVCKCSSLNSHNLSIKSLFQAQMVMYAKQLLPLHDWESHSDTFFIIFQYTVRHFMYLSVLWR